MGTISRPWNKETGSERKNAKIERRNWRIETRKTAIWLPGEPFGRPRKEENQWPSLTAAETFIRGRRNMSGKVKAGETERVLRAILSMGEKYTHIDINVWCFLK